MASQLVRAAGRAAAHSRRFSAGVSRRTASSYVAAVDQGTSSTRVILYDAETGVPVPGASHQIPLNVATPHPGWAQIDPLEIVASVEACASGALSKCGATAADVVGIGITNQRETTLVWDRRTGEPLHDAVVWYDTRTRPVVAALEKELGGADALRGVCGLPISTYFSGVKLRWLLDHVPTVHAAVDAGNALVGTVDSWLVWKLTGGAVHATDVTNASRTMLMDLKGVCWSESAADALGVSAALPALPEIRSCAEPFGTVAEAACPSLGGAPITACIGDQQSAMVGQRCFHEGMVKTTYGTGAFTLINCGDTPAASTSGLLSTALFRLGPSAPTAYALEGAVGSCAVGQNWFVTHLGMFADAREIHELAAEIGPGASGVQFVSAFGGLLAPRWRDDARGTLVGLTLAHDRRHVARAIVDGIAHQVREVVDAMVEDSGLQLRNMRVDGGVANSDVLLQAQADLLGTAVERPRDVETTALGAALCAGVGAGVWSPQSIGDEAAATARSGESVVERVFKPEMDADTRGALCERWDRAVRSSLGWATDEE